MIHGNNGKKRTLEQKNSIVYKERNKKISKSLTGRKLSKEHIEKLKLSHLGQIAWNKGKKIPEISGEKNKNWKGGISKLLDYKSKKYKEWLTNNYDRKLWLNNKRKIRKLENGGFHTLTEWENLKAQYNWTCPCCKGKEPEIKLTGDHIIPLSRGGSDNIENIQPLCKNCNCKKRAKIIKYA